MILCVYSVVRYVDEGLCLYVMRLSDEGLRLYVMR